MKNLSKVGIIILILTSCQSVFTSCKKENDFESQGIVFALDGRKCANPCCGGYFIKIKNDTFRFDPLKVPLNWDVTTEKMPFNVKLNWEKTPLECAKELISVSKIEKIN